MPDNSTMKDAQALTDDAMQLLEAGRPLDARALYADICRLTPGDPDAWLMAAAISGDLGLADEARGFLQRALALDPVFPDAHLALATLHHRESQLRPALAECDLALQADREFAEAWLLRSAVLGAMGRFAEAVDCARRTLALWPDCADACVNLGNGLDAMGQREPAIEAYRQALALDPNLHAAYAGLAEALVNLGRTDEAAACCAKAVELAPGDPACLRAQARVLQQQGRNEDAFRILEPMIGTGALDAGAAVTLSRACIRLKRPELAASAIENMLAQTDLSIDTRWKLHMAIGRVYDDMKDYDRAFGHFERGHLLKRGGFDPVAHRAFVTQRITSFSPAAMARLPRARVKSDLPVFIVGMPRSGTTLVEQILSSHPAVFGAGELLRVGDIAQRLPARLESTAEYPFCISDLTQEAADAAAREYLDYLRGLAGSDAARVTDKLPGNFMHLGLIELLFPDARVIHCMRDPLDTCVSCYAQNFNGHEYTHDLAHLGLFHREYRRMMAYWRSVLRLPMLDVQYEDLIGDIEAGGRRLIEFCGLPWDEQCLRFYENERTVMTASSDQVRQPIYRTSAERWRNYEKYLGPLREALVD